MDTAPRISIITPLKVSDDRSMAWAIECLKSVQAQTVTEWEQIIVNDHSEMSLDPLRELFDDPRVIGLRAESTGVSPARNQAVSVAKADLLLPVDADDLLPPNSLERFLYAWDHGGSVEGIVYSDVHMFGPDYQKHYSPPEYDFMKLLHSTIMTVACLHRKSDWRRVGGWRHDLDSGLEDLDYWLTLGEQGVCGFKIAETLYHYRRHPFGRLGKIRATQGGWEATNQRVRDLHRDSFNGKFAPNCCVSKGTVQPQPLQGQSRVVARAQAVARGIQVAPGLTRVMYTGHRQGGFGLRGIVSGIRYKILGANQPVINAATGAIGVDPRDVATFKQMNHGMDFVEV